MLLQKKPTYGKFEFSFDIVYLDPGWIYIVDIVYLDPGWLYIVSITHCSRDPTIIIVKFPEIAWIYNEFLLGIMKKMEGNFMYRYVSRIVLKM